MTDANDVMAAFDLPVNSGTEQMAAQMAEEIAIEDDALEHLADELKTRKEKLDNRKTELAQLMMQAGMDSMKLESGLSPKAKIDRKFYKAGGVSDDGLMEWLKGVGLGDIIKPTVKFYTMQSALRLHEEQGHELPSTIFNVVSRPTVILYGKSKFLGARNTQ